MLKNRMTVWMSVLSTLLLAGCASAPPERTLSQDPALFAALPNGNDPLHPDQPSPVYASTGTNPGENVIRSLERKRGHALQLLSISGGGQNGAFGAGFLNGWRESGDRPEFDIVGGVSTGALLATHALLGTEADDAKLEEMYKSRRTISIRSEASPVSCLAPTPCETPRPCRGLSQSTSLRRPWNA